METIKTFGPVELVILVALGLAVLLFGYRIKKVAFFIIWFIIGFNTMQLLMPTLESWVPQIVGNELWQVLLPIAGGLLLALIGFSIEKLCLALTCFGLVMLITIEFFGTELLTLAIGAIVGVIAGAFAVRMMKPAIIVATALCGAYALTLVLLAIIPQIDPHVWYWIILVGLAIVGSLFQLSTTKHAD